MTTLKRKMRRKVWGKRFAEKFPRPEQRYTSEPDGSYTVYHPTRGPQRFSIKRQRAQLRLAYMLGG